LTDARVGVGEKIMQTTASAVTSIGDATATQRRPVLPFLPLTVSQRRRRSLDDAAPTSCDRRRHRTVKVIAEPIFGGLRGRGDSEAERDGDG